MATTTSASKLTVSAQEEQYLTTLTDMFSTLSPTTILACLRKHQSSMEDTVVELLSTTQRVSEVNEKKTTTHPLPTQPENSLQLSQAQRLEQLKQQQASLETKIQQHGHGALPPTVMTSSSPFPDALQLTQSLTSSTLSKMQQELNKVYENSFAVMEDKLREQAAEIKHLKEALAARDMVIHKLQGKIVESQDRQTQRSESKQVITDLVGEVRKNLDKGIDSILTEASSVEVSRLTKIIKHEIALAFLDDSQPEKQHPPPVVHNGNNMTMHSHGISNNHSPLPQLTTYPPQFNAFSYNPPISFPYPMVQPPGGHHSSGQPILMQMPMPSAPYDAIASAPAVESSSDDLSSNATEKNE